MFTKRLFRLARATDPSARSAQTAPRRGSRSLRRAFARTGASVLVMALVALLVLDTASSSLAFGPGDGVIGFRQQSTYEQTFNPFGDPWSTKQAPNPSIPNWLTPMCHRTPIKDTTAVPPNADEVAFNTRTNTGFLWEECGDPFEASGGNQRNGDQVLKNYVAAVKQANPNVKYIGYWNSVVHSIGSIGAEKTPVGLLDFDPIESFFLHRDGTDPNNRNNRILYNDGRSHLYDQTNAQWRQAMANKIKESLDFHQVDGLVVDACFDQPLTAPGEPVPQAKLNAWTQGCIDLLATLKQTMPNKLIYFTGYRHIGTQTQPSPVNEEAAFQLYQQRLNVTDGFFWEDPLGPISPGVTLPIVRFAVGRFERVRDAAVAQGKLMANIVNTNVQGMSSFNTTDRAQQLAFERFYLAAHMILSSGLNTPFIFFTPTSINNSFASDAFFKDWDFNIGSATGNYTQPTEGVFVREFQNARVAWNFTPNPFNIGLTDGTFRTLDGTPVANFQLPGFSGMIFLKPEAQPIPFATPTPTPSPTPTFPPEQTACTPTRPPIRTNVVQVSPGVLQVTLTSVNGQNGYIRSVQIDAPRNATVNFANGQQGIAAAHTHTASGGTTSQVVTINRVGAGAYTVQMTVTDGCGTWKTFAGAGSGAG